MNYSTVIKEMKEGHFAPLYLDQTKEAYFSQQLIETLKQTFLGEAENFNFFQFDLSETSMTEVVAEATSYSFFADRKVIILKQMSALKKEEEALWMDYLSHLQEEVVILIQQGDKKLDKRKKWVKQLTKVALIIEDDELNTAYYEAFIKKHIQPCMIDFKAIQSLIQRTNGNLLLLSQELEKLVLYKQEGEITLALVENNVPATVEHHLFDISNNIMNRHLKDALDLYHDLLLQGEDTIKMNYLLLMQFRLYIQVKILMDQQYSPKKISQILKVHPYRVELAYRQVKGQSALFLGELYSQLVNIDYELKHSSMDQEMLFELMLTYLSAYK